VGLCKVQGKHLDIGDQAISGESEGDARDESNTSLGFLVRMLPW